MVFTFSSKSQLETSTISSTWQFALNIFCTICDHVEQYGWECKKFLQPYLALFKWGRQYLDCCHLSLTCIGNTICDQSIYLSDSRCFPYEELSKIVWCKTQKACHSKNAAVSFTCTGQGFIGTYSTGIYLYLICCTFQTAPNISPPTI